MKDSRKTSRSDLESKKSLFFQIGLLLSLAIVIGAFQWRSYDKRNTVLMQRLSDDIPEEFIPVTKQKIKPPPPPKQITKIKIIDDDIPADDDIEIDAEADQSTPVDIFIPEDDEEERIPEDTIFIAVQDEPQFSGGWIALRKYLSSHLKYPSIARESGIQGIVYVNFVVEPDGSISNVKLLRGIGGGCDEEAVRVVKNMPRWKPGMQLGKPVRVSFNLPVKFILR